MSSRRSASTVRLNVGPLSAALTSTGSLERFDVEGLSLLQYPASELEPGVGGLWVRRLHPDGTAVVQPLTGPCSGSRVVTDVAGATVAGGVGGLEWVVRLAPSESDTAWFWHIAVRNSGFEPVTLDAVWASDVALAPYAGVRINEYYVAQYLDLTPVQTPQGVALAVRQNMPGERQPWVLLGSTSSCVGWATDARQLLGNIGGLPALAGLERSELPSERLQHEHTLAVLASAPVEVAPGSTWTTSFYGILRADHPEASGPGDAGLAAVALALPEATASTPSPSRGAGAAPTASLFTDAPALEVSDLALADLAPFCGPGTRLLEEGEGGWWSFVSDAGEAFTSRHKEGHVLRPHGHVLRTGVALTPSTDALTSTVYLAGLFASQVTQGHVARLNLLSGRRTYLGLQRAHGLRVFADSGDGWRLLDVPSVWGLLPDRARWLYATPGYLLEVTADARPENALTVEFRTLRGAPPRLLVAAHLATGGDDGADAPSPEVTLAAGAAIVHAESGIATIAWTGVATASDDSPLFADGTSRNLPWLTLYAPGDLTITLTADLVPADDAVVAADTRPPAGSPRLSVEGPLASAIEALDATLPWFQQNALIHYLSPRGLEQYTGGGWGTRDVSQGPVGLLIALDATDALRKVILQIMAGQNDRGDWPQAFDFLPPKRYWEQFTSHGDVVLWPLLAASDYLLATGDGTLLDEAVTFVATDGTAAPPATVLDHLDRALTLVEGSTVAGSALPKYGHGDWNDSLQPADPRLAERMVSTWTAVLLTQALSALASSLTAAAPANARAVRLAVRCRVHADAVRAAIRDHLLADGLLAGYGVFDDASGRPTALLVHPRDTMTGLTFGVLPWIHAITGDLLTPAEAEAHLDALREHLLGPDGAHLFDHPTAYRGGPLQVFKRAEAATFWGREIGLMYTHAHLRYAEALARYGDGAGLLNALLLVCPFGLTERVPQARPRQSTCYYSSSDGTFADRYDAARRYPDLMAGHVPLEGGWRVYSSGPGLLLRIVVQCLLGLRRRGDRLEVDPVLDPRLDGLQAVVPLAGRLVTFRFQMRGDRGGVKVSAADGRALPAARLINPYRPPGVSVLIADLGGGPVDVVLG
jgi:1,2-beta-oligoglucan phosphorylase